MRAVDHAVEAVYAPFASEMPWKVLAVWALGVLFECLPKSHTEEEGDDVITRLQLAAFASSGFRGKNVKGPRGLGLSHSLGHALGSPYGIPRKYHHLSTQHNTTQPEAIDVTNSVRWRNKLHNPRRSTQIQSRKQPARREADRQTAARDGGSSLWGRFP